MERSSGKIVDTKYTADGFSFFHTINAYEEDGHVVIDVCCYDDGNVIKNLYKKSLEQQDTAAYEHFVATARRFVLPLAADGRAVGGKNLVTLPNSKATAVLRDGGAIHCASELLIPKSSDAGCK